MFRALLAAALLAVLTPAARAQDAYGFTENRKQRWNGTVMDKLPGSWRTRSGNSVFFFSFKTGTSTLPGQGLTIVYISGGGSRFRERWVDHQVVGSDRYSLRGDGRFHINGKKVKELFGVFGSPDWVAFDVDDNGRIYALRRDGAQTNDLDVTADGTVQLADDGAFFMDIVGASNTGASLRSDGALFVSGQPDFALLYFEGGPGQNGDLDGESLDTIWTRVAVNPVTEEVWALRRDGVVQRAPLFPGAQPAEVARLPGVASTGAITLGRLTYPGLGDWVALAFGADGRWAALRGDGLVYGTDDTGALGELVHYNGAKNFKTVFSDLTFLGNRNQAIRRDGAVFRDMISSPVIQMQGDGYIRTEFTVIDPNIDNIRNARPVTARYKARIVQGEAVSVPVISTDTDRPTSQLVIEPDDELPPGVVYDETSRAFLVPDTLPPGSYKLMATVDDGVAKPRRATQKVKVNEPETDPDRNNRPEVSKVSKLQGLTDVELVVPLIVSDRDGDVVTVTPDLTRGVFALPGSDASWDDATRTFRWTPRLSDLRKQRAEFLVSDGFTEKRFKLSIDVLAPFVSD